MQRVSRVDTCTRSNLAPRRELLPTRRHSGTGGGEHTHEEDGDEVKDKDEGDVGDVDAKGCKAVGNVEDGDHANYV